MFGIAEVFPGPVPPRCSERDPDPLREDLWNDLTFQNKSHFEGRYIVLQWRREDVLRLALKQARDSDRFDDLMRRFRPIVDLDAADEETLYSALEPLWGIRMGKVRSKYVYRWVYDRLSDSCGNFFPRAMQRLLIGAREIELGYLRSPHIQPKNDRLLRPDALVDGLKEHASPARTDELREEYPDLVPFLDLLKEQKSPLAESKLRNLWDKAGRPYGRLPSESIGWLESIGILRTSEEGDGWRVVDLYLWGLGMYRDGGP